MKLTAEIIKDLVEEHINSSKKKHMCEAQKYYDGKNDILNKQLNKYTLFNQETQTNEVKINKNKSNHKISHVFHKKLVDQKRAYCCGKSITLAYNSIGKSDEKDINDSKKICDMFWNVLGIKFDSLPSRIIKEESNKGVAWIHPDFDKSGVFILRKYKSEEIIPIYDTETQEQLVGLIHYYTILHYDKRKVYVEVWDEKEVRYYIQDDESYLLDATRTNPQPHFVENILDVLTSEKVETIAHSWGKVPFICFKNNEEMTTDLEPIKDLIDAYDIINSNFVNTVEDAREVIYKIIGYGAEDMLSFIENLKVNGVIRTNDIAGRVDTETLTIPYEARQTLLKGIKQLIYEFGRGVDTSNPDLVGNAPSGVSLEFLYSDLDLKADDCITYLKEGIYEILWYVSQVLKDKLPKDFNVFNFTVDFNKSRIFNEIEKVNALSNDTILSTKTKIGQHPWCDDIDVEIQNLEDEQNKIDKRQQNVTFGFTDRTKNEK